MSGFQEVRGVRKLHRFVKWFGAMEGSRLFLREAFTKNTDTVTVRRKNRARPVTLRLNSSDAETFGKVLAEREYELPTRLQPKTIVDAGANIGLATVYFAEIFPQAKIVALEPEESNFALLQKNAAPYRNVTCLKSAVSATSTKVSLIDTGEGHWGFRTTAVGDSVLNSKHRKIQEIDAVTIPDLMNEFGWDRIDLLKIDVEGAEKEIFEAASPWIDRVNLIVVELHDRFKRGCGLSFYSATLGFPYEFHRGENVFVAREHVPPA